MRMLREELRLWRRGILAMTRTDHLLGLVMVGAVVAVWLRAIGL